MKPLPNLVLVADGDAETRELVARLMHRIGVETVDVARGDQVLAAAAQQCPPVVLLEVSLKGASGYAVCAELRARFGKDVAIVLLSGDRTEPEDRVAGLLLGADDYIVKPFHPDELVARVSRLLPDARHDAIAHGARLTPRERETLALLTEGLTQDEIAGQLFVAPRTVGKHIEHILAKLDVHTRAHAVARALRDPSLLGG